MDPGDLNGRGGPALVRRILLLVALAGAAHVVSMLHATSGRVALPLDDSYIYFRYAEGLTQGRGLAYQPGEAATTGATSLPWVLAMAGGSLLGFGGKAMSYWAMLLGGLGLAVAILANVVAQRSLAPRGPGSERPGDLPILGIPLAGALALLSGPLQWGAWSGMEIAWSAAAVALAFATWCRAGGKPDRESALALALLALVRPEGSMLAILALIPWIAGAFADAGSRKPLAWIALPLAAVATGPLLSLALTGDLRSTGFLAKTTLAGPGADLAGALRTALLRGTSLAGAQLFGLGPRADGLRLYAYESETSGLFVPPGAGLLFLVGILPALAREGRERRVGPGWLALAWIGAMYLATGLLDEPDAHHGRYQMPALPPFLVFVAVGVGRLARALREAHAGLARLADGARVVLGLGGALSVAFFALAFGDQCEDIDRMQIALGESLRTRLEPGAVVAVNDAGALAYFSGHRTVDLIGLTTPGLAGLWRQGSGVLVEALESAPPDRRPGWFCIFPNWFDFEPAGILRRVGSVRLLSPSVVDAEKVVFRADWSLAGSGDVPGGATAGPASRVVDRVDVADPGSERSHAFRFRERERGARGGSFARRGSVDGGAEILDGGRTVSGDVRFEVERDPVSPTRLVVRTAAGVRQVVRLAVDDQPEHEVVIGPGPAGAFHEAIAGEIPPGPGRARIRMTVPRELPSTPLVLCHVFVVAGGAP